MNKINEYSIKAIELAEKKILSFGLNPIIQFELEGTYRPKNNSKSSLDYAKINQLINSSGVYANIKPEYWQYQWELASTMQGQKPLKAANDLYWALNELPEILTKHGADKAYIKPICWGDAGEHRPLSQKDQKDVVPNQIIHVPNAIQINVSASKSDGTNIFADTKIGELLQSSLLSNSQECLFLSCFEDDSIKRLHLKKDYDLEKELSSPHNISGGNQGSIALYKERDKNNNLIGEYRAEQESYDWQPLARLESRIGSASTKYNPYLNFAYIMVNLLDAIEMMHNEDEIDKFEPQEIPTSITDVYSNFISGKWFNNKFNQLNDLTDQEPLGSLLKEEIISNYNGAAGEN